MVDFISSTIFVHSSEKTFVNSVDVTSIASGKPVFKFLPFTFAFFSLLKGNTFPISIFKFSAVFFPINKLCFCQTYFQQY